MAPPVSMTRRPVSGFVTRSLLPLAAAVFLLLAGCGPSGPPRGESAAGQENGELSIFAAASLRDVVTDLGEAFVVSRSAENGPELVTNFAGSNVLARQVVATTGPDVFLSADSEWVDFVAAAGRTLPGSRRELFANRLVVVARPEAGYVLDDVAALASLPFRHLALGQPDAVPAGRYARAQLSSVAASRGAGESVWRAVVQRVAPALDVRAALALAETDPRIVALVYRTDAMSSDEVEIVLELPPHADVPIRYHGVALAESGAEETARAFLDWLEGDVAAEIVERHGFVP